MHGKHLVRRYNITSTPFKDVVKSARYRHSLYTARTVMKSKPLKDAKLVEVSRIVASETKGLCRRSKSPSCLRDCSINHLTSFNWELLISELASRAPTLMQILNAAANEKKQLLFMLQWLLQLC